MGAVKPVRWLGMGLLVGASVLVLVAARAASAASQEKLTPETLAQALQTTDQAERAARLQQGFEIYLEHMRAFRARTAERWAEPLHRAAQAPWSATCYASAKRRGGDPEGAVAILREQIERTSDPAQRVALYEALSLALDAAGQAEQRLNALGHAYAEGGRDAQQILGFLAMQEGRWQEAQRLFGDLVDDARREGRDAEPWALPGWGLAVLEGARPAVESAGESEPDSEEE